MSRVFITSDTHFGHENIIRYCGRPFKSAAVMDEEMISRWNARIEPEDEGRIVVMTTNHPDKLDPALIRPGRADFQIEISTPDQRQVEAMFERFYDNKKLAIQFADGLDCNRLSMAQLQVFFLKNKTPQDAIINRKYLLNEERQTASNTLQGLGLDGVDATPESGNELASVAQEFPI